MSCSGSLSSRVLLSVCSVRWRSSSSARISWCVDSASSRLREGADAYGYGCGCARDGTGWKEREREMMWVVCMSGCEKMWVEWATRKIMRTKERVSKQAIRFSRIEGNNTNMVHGRKQMMHRARYPRNSSKKKRTSVRADTAPRPFQTTPESCRESTVRACRSDDRAETARSARGQATSRGLGAVAVEKPAELKKVRTCQTHLCSYMNE